MATECSILDSGIPWTEIWVGEVVGGKKICGSLFDYIIGIDVVWGLVEEKEVEVGIEEEGDEENWS